MVVAKILSSDGWEIARQPAIKDVIRPALVVSRPIKGTLVCQFKFNRRIVDPAWVTHVALARDAFATKARSPLIGVLVTSSEPMEFAKWVAAQLSVRIVVVPPERPLDLARFIADELAKFVL